MSHSETCSICKRRASRLTLDTEGGRTWHVCESISCVAVVEHASSMKRESFDAFEALALVDGGKAGGGYLDSIGVTDLARLSKDQYHQFLQTVLSGYAQSMRSRLISNAAPF